MKGLNISMSNIFICADWHFGHNKEFIYKDRGFSSVDEMNEQIILRHNSFVEPDDIVYVLGDCVVAGPPAHEHLDWLNALNGRKFLAYGNHDTDNKLALYFDIFEDIAMGFRLKYKKMSFILTHYPTIVGNKDDPTPIYNIHGHTHSFDTFGDYDKCYNVAMEAHNCFPVHIQDIYEDIKKKKQQQ